MTQTENKIPECFGELDIVFPMEDDGLRHTPPTCFECLHKTECLRTGLRGRAGLKVHEEHYRHSAIALQEADSKFEPLENATVHFSISEGEKVKILKTQDGWSKIQRADGKMGWIQEKFIEQI